MDEQVFDDVRRTTESAFASSTRAVMLPEVGELLDGDASVPRGRRSPSASEEMDRGLHRPAAKAAGNAGRSVECGAETIEGAFRVTGAKDPVQFRAEVVELWQEGLESLRQLTAAQLQGAGDPGSVG